MHLEQRVVAGAKHLAHSWKAEEGKTGRTSTVLIASTWKASSAASWASTLILAFFFEASLHLPSRMYMKRGITTRKVKRAVKSASLGCSMSPQHTHVRFQPVLFWLIYLHSLTIYFIIISGDDSINYPYLREMFKKHTLGFNNEL